MKMTEGFNSTLKKVESAALSIALLRDFLNSYSSEVLEN